MDILVEVAPLDPATGSRITLRAASRQDRRITNLNGQRWWPALAELSPIRIPTFDGNFQAGLSPASVSLSLLLDKLVKLNSNARRFGWAGADVTLYGGYAGQVWPWTTLFTGKVAGFQADVNQVRLSAAVDDEPFQRNVLTMFYAGNGGAEGPSDLKNLAKPFLAGRCRNVEPILVDPVNSVFQFHGYGPISAVNAIYERGSLFPASVGNYASYATLVAATITPGKYATCLAEGMIRLGALPYGVITGDVDGDKPSATWFSKTGEIINRLATNAGVASGDIDAASLTALDAAINTLTGGGGIIGLHITEQETVMDLAIRLARACNHQALVSHLGRLAVARPVIGSPVAVFDTQNRRQPGVYECTELDVSPPYARMEMTGFRSWRVHTLEEIAGSVTPVDRGTYDSLRTNREGDLVFQPSDGNKYYYKNTNPTVGIAPPNATYWDLYQVADPSIADLPATLLGPNANRVPFSRFEKILGPWYAYDPSNIRSGNPFTGVGFGRSYFKVNFNATAPNQTISLYLNETERWFPVTPDERLSCQAGIEAAGPINTVSLRLDFFNAAGANVGTLPIGSASGPQSYNTKMMVFGTVPPNAVKGRIIADFKSSGAGVGFGVIIEPMVTQAGDLQEVHPAFTPGPNAVDAADVTGQNVAQAILNQSALATAAYADWLSQVNGAGKPASYATRNEGGSNLLEDPLRMSTYVAMTGSVVYENAGGTAGSKNGRDNYRIRLDANGAYAYLQTTFIPVTPGERLYFACVIYRNAAASGYAEFGYHFFDGAGNYLSGTSPIAVTPPADSWTYYRAATTIPGNCALIRPYFYRSSSAGNFFYFAEPYVGRQEPGADITSGNTAAAIANQGVLATQNLATTGLIAGGAITGGAGALELASDAVGNGAYQTPLSFGFSLADASKLHCTFGALHVYSSGTPQFRLNILLDGGPLGPYDVIGQDRANSVTLFRYVPYVAAGYHTISAYWYGQNGNIRLLAGSTLGMIPFLR